jgi:integrase
MKMRSDHVVPLSKQSLAILLELHPLTGRGRYVFPNVRGERRPISANALCVALRAMGYSKDEMTAHGFRSMACSVLSEQGFGHDVVERQLGHKERNRVRAAYNRA